MYSGPIAATEKFFLPSPEGLWGSGGNGQHDSGSGSSGSKSDKVGTEAMYMHKLGLENEKRSLQLMQSGLYNITRDKLMNEYHGDMAEMQKKEFEKYMDNPDGDSIYAIKSRALRSKAVYHANQVASKREFEKWGRISDKMFDDQAADMIIEDDNGNPLRVGADGELYQAVANEKGTPIFKSISSDKSMPYESGINQPMITAQQYMQSVFYKTGYQNGVAVGPEKYFDTYDMASTPFQKEVNTLLGFAASGGSEAGGSDYGFIDASGIDASGVDPNKAKAFSNAWTFLRETKSTGFSNEKQLKTAVATIYNNLSSLAKKDLRQEWYKAKQQGEGYSKPVKNEKGKIEDKVVHGNDLDLETFLYNRVIGQAMSRIKEGSDFTTNISSIDNFNSSVGRTGEGKTTPLQVFFNPSTIKSNMDQQEFNYYELTGKKDKDNQDVYTKKVGMSHFSQINDPFLLQSLNQKFINPNVSKTDESYYIYDAKTAIGTEEVLSKNGQILDLKGSGAKFAGLTGRLMLGVQMAQENGKTVPKLTGFNIVGKNKEGIDVVEGDPAMGGEQVYAEVQFKVPHVKAFRKANSKMESVSTKTQNYVKTKINDSNYISDQFGMEYEQGMIDWNADGMLTALIPISSSSASISGNELRTGTEANSTLLDGIFKAESLKQQIMNLATP